MGDARLRVRRGGDGPPLLLLHGHPRTHVTWHRVAPLLAPRFTLVCPDLRGYGGSSKPPTTPDHAPYSKRAMAGDMLALMRTLGHERFTVAGHDRGAYVAFRLAMDEPDAAERLVVMDAIPIVEALERCDARFALAWWHWFFLGQADKPAERVISSDPDAWYTATPEQMGEEAFEDWRRAIHDPLTVHAMCEDLWSTRDDLEDLYEDPLAIWRRWADDLRGMGIGSGHHIGEDAPDELVAALVEFAGGDAV